jgi:GNAT superfamily N-acetyltransferase
LNAAIAGRRAAAPVAVREFRRRVYDHPGFDRQGLLLAVAEGQAGGGQIVGAVQAIAPAPEIPLYRRLAGQGFLFGPYVRGEARHTGVGRALLAEAEEYLAGRCSRVWVHGLRAPFYHFLEGPRQPYCGSTEMTGLTRDDVALLRFLSVTGYSLGEEQEVSMAARLRPAERRFAAPVGMELARVSPQQPWQGPVAWAGVESGYGYETHAGFDYDTLAVAKGGVLLGHCQWYPMRRAGRAALYDLRLDPSLRGLGIGKLLLEAGLDAMWRAGYREVELHTSPQRNALAYAMYRRYGFRQIEAWLPLQKTIA